MPPIVTLPIILSLRKTKMIKIGTARSIHIAIFPGSPLSANPPEVVLFVKKYIPNASVGLVGIYKSGV